MNLWRKLIYIRVNSSHKFFLYKQLLILFCLFLPYHRHYGDIEEINIEEPIENRPPLYAHVIFYSQVTLFRVLDGNRRVKFMTRGKHIWARQFVPKKKKNFEV
jgi:hypothetical protein